MIPRLARFYGGTPTAWLEEVPVPVVLCHLDMLERLRAEEALHAGSVAAAARFDMRPAKRRQLWRSWLRTAGPARRRSRPRPLSDLKAMGVGVQFVSRPGAPEAGEAGKGPSSAAPGPPGPLQRP